MLLAAWLGGDLFILRQVKALVKATRRLESGDLKARTGLPHSAGELGELARVFDHMAEALEQREAERDRAQEEMRRNLQRIQALHQIDLAIMSSLGLRSVLNVVAEQVDLFFPYPAAVTISLFNKAGELEPTACWNLNEEDWKREMSKEGAGLAKTIIDSGLPFAIANVQTDPRSRQQEFHRKHRLVSCLGLPLSAKDKPLGTLFLYTKEAHDFTDSEIDFLKTLAGQASIAIHNAQLYEDLKAQAEVLERANKVKDEFLSVMSHELRTPLQVVTGYVGMIKDGLLGEINPQQEEALAKVISRANDQLSIVNNILYATVLEAEKIKPESSPIVLGDLFQQLSGSYEIPVNKKLALHWDCPAPLGVIHTDSGKLKHILQNLIDNAIKFTDKGSITIAARVIAASPHLRVGWGGGQGGDAGTRGRGEVGRVQSGRHRRGDCQRAPSIYLRQVQAGG